MYTKRHIQKIGNTFIYLANNVNFLTKTKLIKLLYILDELSIKKTGVPFLNLEYKVWKFGPVPTEIFIELASKPVIFKDFIYRDIDIHGNNVIESVGEFDDSEFSDYEIELMDIVAAKFISSSASDLIEYTHKEGSPWYNAAKENNVLESLLSEAESSTDYLVNMKELIGHDKRKLSIYEEHISSLSYYTHKKSSL